MMMRDSNDDNDYKKRKKNIMERYLSISWRIAYTAEIPFLLVSFIAYVFATAAVRRNCAVTRTARLPEYRKDRIYRGTRIREQLVYPAQHRGNGKYLREVSSVDPLGEHLSINLAANNICPRKYDSSSKLPTLTD